MRAWQIHQSVSYTGTLEHRGRWPMVDVETSYCWQHSQLLKVVEGAICSENFCRNSENNGIEK